MDARAEEAIRAVGAALAAKGFRQSGMPEDRIAADLAAIIAARTLEPAGWADEPRVKVRVVWRDRGHPQSFVISLVEGRR
ncbi:MAG: hypothetical protein M0002_03330 [Rhodospirillales bacterium]|nr:hypothetical protein [Rhodospirillales bacterium]